MEFLPMNKNFKTFLVSILIVTISYFVATIIKIFLPNEGVEAYQENNAQIKIKYHILDSFGEKISAQEITKPKTTQGLISNIKLKTLFAFGAGNGFVILEDKKKDTYILENGQKYNEYELIKVYANSAIFQKGNKTYSVNIDTNNVLANRLEVTKEAIINNRFTVKKKDIQKHTKNMGSLWKEISIAPVTKGGIITGFKIKNIKSKFFKALGVKKNDIITKINGIDASNNKQLLKLYSKISTLKAINMAIIRDGKEVDLVYEVK
jgi:type II secretion system protein C